MHQRSFPRLLAACLLLLACACNSAGSKEEKEPEFEVEDNTRERPLSEVVSATNEPDPIGLLLARIDGSMKRWNELQLTGKTAGDREKLRKLELWIAGEVHRRRAEIIEQLEGGPRQNRVVAAMALGFTREQEVQSPLLAALDDKESEVVANALLGLWLLERDDTPLQRIADHMRTHQDPGVRSNASLCLMTLVNKGASGEGVVEAARLGLLDDEPTVRSHAALTLGSLLDAESVQALADHLTDAVPIVAAASAKALAHIGTGVPREKGRVARALVKGLDETKGPVQDEVHLSLAQLAGVDRGRDSSEWIEWAMRLP